jgi:hypothetical protein
MVCFGTAVADAQVQERIANLADLKIELTLRESETELRKAQQAAETSKPSSPSKLDDRDRAAAQKVSQKIARSLRLVRNGPTVSQDLRQEVVREEVHRRSANASSPQEKAEDIFAGLGSEAGPPNDSLADQVAEIIQKEAEENRGGIREKIRVWALKHDELADSGDLREFFEEQILDPLFDLAPHLKSPLFDEGVKIVTKELQARAQKAVHTAINHTLTAMFHDVSAEDFLEHLPENDSLWNVLTKDDSDILRKAYADVGVQKDWATQLRSDRLGVESHENDADVFNAKRILADLPEEVAFGRETELANLVSTYEAEFPVSDQKYTRDAVTGLLGQKRASLGGDVPVYEDSNNLTSRIDRAIDYEKLRSYSRVGGVLIGRDPMSTQSFHLADIDWKITGDRISLRLVQGPNQVKEFGAFPLSLVHRALAYATDPRPAALTMLNAEFIDRKQVLIHPALRNTQLGAHVAEADEWIFRYLEPDPPSPPSELRNTIEAMYAETKLYEAAVAAVKPKQDGVSAIVPLGTVRRYLNKVTGAELLRGSSAFDERLLNVAMQCLTEPSDNGFSTCVRQKTAGADWIGKLPNAPYVAFVSQIFEPQFVADSDLKFLAGVDPDDVTWPLKFTVQMTVNDRERITVPEFMPEHEKDSTRVVLEGIRREGHEDQFDELRSFTRLQRLFRVAMAGSFGPQFPLEKLILLTDATKTSEPDCPTPRWLQESRLGGESLEAQAAQELRNLLPEAPLALQPSIRMCVDSFAGTGSERSTPEDLARQCSWEPEWQLARKSCAQANQAGLNGNSLACRTFDTMRELNYVKDSVIYAHRLRTALGAVDAPKHVEQMCIARQ